METTLTFNDAMARLSETLYSSAKVHVNTRRTGRLTAPKLNADAWEYLTFDLKVDARGEVNTQVDKYCAGYTLRCTASIDSSYAGAVLAGHVHSNHGGGAVFGNFRLGKSLRFDLGTSFWHSTTFTLHLRTSPALPAGTVLKVSMDIDY